MKLKNEDIRLLTYLYSNSRDSHTKIAKSVKLSREQVAYKIKKYVREGIIKNFATIFNWPALGYNYIIILLSNYAMEENQSDIKHIISDGLCIGKYQRFYQLIFKDETEFVSWYNNKKNLHKQLVLKPFHVELFPLKFLDNKKPEEPYLFSSDTPYSLDAREIQIIKMLDKNHRIKLIDIANKIKSSPELTLHKLRKLQKNIILGSRINFDMRKIGYSYSIVMINARLNTKDYNKLKEFSRNHKYINSLILSIGQPNVVVQLFHNKQEQLLKTIKELQFLLNPMVDDLDILFIEKDNFRSTVPFL